ncbi:MAG: TIGR00725 family protein [Chloroflexi bacterium]|nr:TIGR00725 family protein [Chloroflexota bacterium]
MRISVIGGQEADERASRVAFEVGREIGARGHVLICGGRTGVMREACRGAKESGGLTVGILPGDDLGDVNEFVDIPLPTGIGYTRNVLVARAGEAVIAIDGQLGTLSEIAFALISGRPVVGLGTWELRDGSGQEAPIERVEDAVSAVDACEAAVAAAGSG